MTLAAKKDADLVVIDSGGANIASVVFAFERLGQSVVFSDDPDVIAASPKVLLPGVGAAADAMRMMSQKDGLIECIKSLTQPVLGICLGMQLLFTHSDEGDAGMLDIIKGNVTKFKPQTGFTIPHMGWNALRHKGHNHDLLKNIPDESYYYFVHSYKAPKGDFTIGTCDYTEPFSAIVSQDNFMGCQFHPERSGPAGQKLLQNFLEI